jgi:hypothetical protein
MFITSLIAGLWHDGLVISSQWERSRNMVVPIDALRDPAVFAAPFSWRDEPAAEEPSIGDGSDPMSVVRGIAFALAMSAVLWTGLIAGGRALMSLLH